MRRLVVVMVALSCSLMTLLRADEGRIPIFGPTTITAPGSYVVTRDFNVTSGDGITISASNVTLDLNEHTVDCTATSGACVRLTGGASSIRIRNGRLSGGGFGIYSSFAGNSLVMTIERVEITNQGTGVEGIRIDNPKVIEILESIIRIPTGIATAVNIYNGPFTGRLVDNTIENTGTDAILLVGCENMDVRGNTVYHTGGGLGISVQCAGARIVGNSLYGFVSGSGAIEIRGPGASGGANLVLDNTIRYFSQGITLRSTWGNRLAGNTVQGVGSGNALEVVSSGDNLIEDNQLGNFGCGIRFTTAPPTNAYRNNFLRTNTTAAVCGVAATDAGGNIF